MSNALVWNATDADERYPGLFTAHVTETVIDGITYRARITPGDSDFYTVPGFYAEVWSLTPDSRWSVRDHTLNALMARVADEMADDAFAVHTADYLLDA